MRCNGCGTADEEAEIGEACVDCGYRACADCECHVRRGNCSCPFSIFGSAYCDELDRIPDWGYRGKYKSVVQIVMEQILSGKDSYDYFQHDIDPASLNFKYCSAHISNGDHPRCMVLLADVQDTDKKFCSCGCVVYCSEACRGKDSYSVELSRGLNYIPQHEDDDNTQLLTHNEVCKPYLPPEKWTAISVYLRTYRAEFNRYPGPFYA